MSDLDARPLMGRRILITRTPVQGSKLAQRLTAAGADTLIIPTIELAPPLSWCALDAALACIRSYDWVIFTSANAVEPFVRRGARLGLAVEPRRIAVIGSATARAVEAAGMAVDLLPKRFVAESLAEALRSHADGASMLIVRAEEGRDVLPNRLSEAGAAVQIAAAYRNVTPADSAAALHRAMSDPAQRPHAITFTSASTAMNFFQMLTESGATLDRSIALVSIGPVTSEALRDLGYQVAIEADEATIKGLVQALIAYCKRP